MADIKRLYRSNEESTLAGICAGLGFHFGIDPVIVRLIWIAATLMTGVFPGLIGYGIAWLIIPGQPRPAASYAPPVHQAEPVQE